MNGKVKSADGTKRVVSFNNNYTSGTSEDIQFKKLDAGANFMVGYEFKNKFSAGINTQLGLVNINPESNIPDDKTSYRNTGFGVSLGYRL